MRYPPGTTVPTATPGSVHTTRSPDVSAFEPPRPVKLQSEDYRLSVREWCRIWRPALIMFATLFVGLLLLAGFVFHEVGIVTPLDGAYMWLHDTFGPGEGHTVAGWMW